MTEALWLTCLDPIPMLEFFSRKPVSRKLRLFAVACCHRVRHLLVGEKSWDAIQAAERQAEVGELFQGEMAVDDVLARAADALEVVAPQDRPYPNAPAYYATWQHALDAATSTGHATLEAIQYAGGDADVERSLQVSTIREIFGNPPFSPAGCDPSWLFWNGGTIPALARTIYDERELPSGHLDAVRLALLADMLEDAGCADSQILDHLRGPRRHVRGCWVIDLILSKDR